MSLGEPAKVALVLLHSLEVSGGGKAKFILLAQCRIDMVALCAVTLASY